ncbi:hypothetical protein GALMADRAFT_135605 [Galerina marginata CBS 339.88]|uniref:F-box domain-containing protein n=1 Tax=Galerina marginata (strain CBS 339.88) TaxID=685588 RepID=A0A067TG92_GALM3|nr:hypothetical protein GALMADRAFT_135605 [Galerina marginata CBS 339.88]
MTPLVGVVSDNERLHGDEVVECGAGADELEVVVVEVLGGRAMVEEVLELEDDLGDEKLKLELEETDEKPEVEELKLPAGRNENGGQAQISRLHEDILYYIFELNADMYLEEESNSSDDDGQTSSDPNDNALNDHALNVIRHTSQVCRCWRGLIIGSPMIWGNIIDLNLLRQVNNLWRKEVIKRTGNSRLSVKGVVKCKGSTGEFFADLMKNHWLRIRKLNVKIYDYQFLDDETWQALQHPAPHLEFFKLDIEYWGELPTHHSSLTRPHPYVNSASPTPGESTPISRSELPGCVSSGT